MSERTERSEGHERMPSRLGMSERTERSEGHERMPSRLSPFMTDSPALAQFTALAEEYTVVPVWRDVLADMDTPIAIFSRIGGGEGSVLLESVDRDERWGRYSFIGLDPVTTLLAHDGVVSWTDGPICAVPDAPLADVLRAILSTLRAPDLPDMPPLVAGMIGVAGFDALRTDRRPPTSGTPTLEAAFMFPRNIVVLDHSRQRLRLITTVLVDRTTEIDDQYADAQARLDGLLVRLAGLQPIVPTVLSDSVPPLPIDSDLSNEEYGELVVAARDRVLDGQLRQVTVARRFFGTTGVDPLTVYRMLRVTNPSPYMYVLRLPGVTMVGSSPLGLVNGRDGHVTSYAIAGTRPRGEDADADAKLAAELAQDAKELAEHRMLVELALADLGRVARPGSVQIVEQERVVRYNTVMHLVTQVRAMLGAGRTALDAVEAVSPAGTVSGTPRAAAQRVIGELEPKPRGLYGGSVGYLGFAGNFDVCLGIRALQFTGSTVACWAGAGVVADSIAELEVRESRVKAQAVFTALAMATALRPGAD